MKTTLRVLVPLAGLFALTPLASHAASGQSNVSCSYSHTLGDDAILMFGMPNHAMLHDFFGNTSTDAYSTYDTLQANPETTCNNKADSTAYWAPTMKLPSGEIVKPSYQKTYYQANSVEKYPLTPFPKGLQLLAGDHVGTAPNPHVSFLCANGNGYTNTADQVCGLRSGGDAVQFNIGINFPNCWDGVHLTPVNGQANATYDSNNVCPANFPVKIPKVNMNIAYVLPQITSLDTSKIQLSLDPEMVGDQRIEKWGSIYTAHGDFVNGWPEQSAKYMTDLCMNLAFDCSNTIPYSYEPALEDTVVSSTNSSTNYGSSTLLTASDNWKNGGHASNPESLVLFKFKIPALPEAIPASEEGLFVYRLRVFGGNAASSATGKLNVYSTSTDWDGKTVNWDNHPATDYQSAGTISMNNNRQYRDAIVDTAVRQALAEGKMEVAFYLGGDQNGGTYTFDSTETNHPPLLIVKGYKAATEN